MESSFPATSLFQMSVLLLGLAAGFTLQPHVPHAAAHASSPRIVSATTTSLLSLALRARADDDDDLEFEVELSRPLGLKLQQASTAEPVSVALVYEGSNACEQGIQVGDVVVATSATVGAGMWPKSNLAGVESAISTRIDGRVRLRLRRPATRQGAPLWQGPLMFAYELELSPPVGLALRQRAAGEGALAVEVAGVLEGSSAASSAILPGDYVVATSASVGDTMWEKSSVSGVAAAIDSRLRLCPTVRLRLTRRQQLGPWAAELAALAAARVDEDGPSRRLSLAALRSLRAQRRQMRWGALAGAELQGALRELCRLPLEGIGRGLARHPTAQASAVGAAVLRSVLRRCRCAGISLDARLANAAMAAALRLGKARLAIEAFEQLVAPEAQGAPPPATAAAGPDARVYTSLIKAHSALGQAAEALAVEVRMEAQQVAPTVQTYNTLMAVCARGGDRAGLLRYFAKIGSRGLRPSVASWNVVLDFCAKTRGEAKHAPGVLARMRQAGLTPDSVSYGALASACLASGSVGGLQRLLDEMDADGVAPDTRLLNTALSTCAKTLQWELGFELIERLKAMGAVADATSFGHLLHACQNSRAPAAAERALEQMVTAGLPPEIRHYSMLLSALGGAGLLETCERYLDQLRAAGLRPNRFVFSALMEASVVGGQPGRARAFFAEMRAAGVTADLVTYTLLLRAVLAVPSQSSAAAVGGETPPAEATRLVLQMQAEAGSHNQNGVAPNVVALNALIEGCMAWGDADRALAALAMLLQPARTMAGDVGSRSRGRAGGKSPARLARGPNRRTFEILARGLAAVPAAGSEVGGGASGEAADRKGHKHDHKPAPDLATRAAARAVARGRTRRAQLDFLLRAISIFDERRRAMGGEVYLAALRAAERAGDAVAGAALVEARRECGHAKFRLRREHERSAARLEAAIARQRPLLVEELAVEE
jgi:pentatricopeptide repeat protein